MSDPNGPRAVALEFHGGPQASSDSAVAWIDEWANEGTTTALSTVAKQVLDRFALGAALPEEHAALTRLQLAVRTDARPDAIEAALRQAIDEGYLRGALSILSEALMDTQRIDLALRIARELLDAIDVELGIALSRAILAHPEAHAQRLERTGPAVMAHQAIAAALEDRGDTRGALRHWEAVLAVDVDHARALSGFARCARALERTGIEPPRARAGLAILDGLDDVEWNDSLGTDRYTLGRPLGRGRHALVYEALDRHMGRSVALKRLLRDAGRDFGLPSRWIETRFFQEARALAAVRHPNVVSLLDVRAQQRFIALELCAGGNLRMAVRRKQIGAAQLDRLAAQLQSALAAVHAAGAIHRDLKPANILVRDTTEETDFVLADFGLAVTESLPSTRGAQTTEPHALPPDAPARAAGTLRYLAPEVRRGGLASPSSDLYSAGIVLLEIALWPQPLPRALDRLDPSEHAEDWLPSGLPEALAERLRRLLAAAPEERSW